LRDKKYLQKKSTDKFNQQQQQPLPAKGKKNIEGVAVIWFFRKYNQKIVSMKQM